MINKFDFDEKTFSDRSFEIIDSISVRFDSAKNILSWLPDDEIISVPEKSLANRDARKPDDTIQKTSSEWDCFLSTKKRPILGGFQIVRTCERSYHVFSAYNVYILIKRRWIQIHLNLLVLLIFLPHNGQSIIYIF